MGVSAFIQTQRQNTGALVFVSLSKRQQMLIISFRDLSDFMTFDLFLTFHILYFDMTY